MLAARLLSRAVAQAATNGKFLGAAKNVKQVQLMPVRHSGDWTYRTAATQSPLWKRVCVQIGGGCKFANHLLRQKIKSTVINEIHIKKLFSSILVMWWWIIWHLYWEWGHIVGEFEYPDTSKWTDEELGIPPDDEE